jgi:DNA-directed RNA polymerase specialized sigma24 family protein
MAEPADAGPDLSRAYAEALALKERYAEAVDRVVRLVPQVVAGCVRSMLGAGHPDMIDAAKQHLRIKMFQSLPNWEGREALVGWAWKVTGNFVKDELQRRRREAAVSIQTGGKGRDGDAGAIDLPQEEVEYPTDAQIYREALRAVLEDTKNPMETLVYVAQVVVGEAPANTMAAFDPSLPDPQSLTLAAYATKLKRQCCALKLAGISPTDWNRWFLPLEQALAGAPGKVRLKYCALGQVDHRVLGARRRFISRMNQRACQVFQRAASVYPPHTAITYSLTAILRQPISELFWKIGEPLDSLFDEMLSRIRAGAPDLTPTQMERSWKLLKDELDRLEPGPDEKRIGTFPLSHWLTGADAEARKAELAGWRDTAHEAVVAGLRHDEIGLVFAYASGILAGSAGKRRRRRSEGGRANR